MLVIHPHFHPRRTGVTTHTESLVTALAPHTEVFAVGRTLQSRIPQMRWGELFSRLRREAVIWHAHRNNELLFGFLLRLFAKKLHIVFTRHGSYPPSGITRLIAPRADKLITLGEHGRKMMPTQSEVIPHGIPYERFPLPKDRQALWRGHRLGGEFGIGVVGRIRPNKGQGDFVKAVTPLLEELPAWRAVLVGLVKRRWVRWADSLRAATGDKLVLAGEHANVLPWYQSFTVVVLPSHAESFGLVMLEAMASGCCLVATELPHVKQYVEHGRTGFMYPVGDADALQKILRELMNDPAKARAIGEAAAREVRERFGIDHEAAAMQRLYATLS